MRTMNAWRAAKLPESKEEGTDVGEKKKKLQHWKGGNLNGGKTVNRSFN